MKKNISKKKSLQGNLVGDIFGGTTAMLVALPAAIAFGLIIYAPLGPTFSGRAAIGGIIGTIVLGLLAPLIGGTKRLVTAPCAPAAAVLAVFVTELVNTGSIPTDVIPVYITLVALFAGVIQLIIGKIGGGKFIKYIPYPVVTGYLSGVGILIFIGQLPKFLGLPKEIKIWEGIFMPHEWKLESISVGIITIVGMLFAPKIIKIIPAVIIGLLAGIVCYFSVSSINPALLMLEKNPFIIGPISASVSDLYQIFINQWTLISTLDFNNVNILLTPVITLSVLLSIDTLKTCVVLDALTLSRHNSNRELFGQGIGNIGSALFCGIPGAGTMGATLVNLTSGGKTKMSGVFVGISALLVLFLFGKLMAWIPFAALAGVLIVVAIRMIDNKSFALLKHKSTVFDFVVILAVVISAVTISLITAAGVGIAMAIILFLREQTRTSVIRRKVFGNQKFSKRSRLTNEHVILEEKGKHTLIVELQGQLFFGTADQLLSEIEPMIADCKYVLLDMRRVKSIDFTAANRMKQILARIKEKNGFLIFTSIPMSLPSGQNVKEYLEYLGLSETENLKFFDDLDSAMEYVEDEILREEKIKDDGKILSLNEIEFFSEFSDDILKTFSLIIDEKTYMKGELIFKKKDEGNEIYFIRKGNIKIVLPLFGGVSHHLVTIAKGGFFGDMSFLDKRKRSADALSMDDSMLYVLSRNKFDEVAIKHPEVAGNFFEKLAYVIANRLRLSDKELKALQED
ncbi:MAG: SLC26A/SulP transporter family protein [Bacteroidota bacterium]